MKILGIETSFDETGVAIVEDGTKIISNVLATSAELHIKSGGVIPEKAAREQLKFMLPTLQRALDGVTKDEIDVILRGRITYDVGKVMFIFILFYFIV